MTWADLAEYAQFNKDFLADVQAGVKAGKTPDDIAASWKIADKYKGYSPGPAREENVQVIATEYEEEVGSAGSVQLAGLAFERGADGAGLEAPRLRKKTRKRIGPAVGDEHARGAGFRDGREERRASRRNPTAGSRGRKRAGGAPRAPASGPTRKRPTRRGAASSTACRAPTAARAPATARAPCRASLR